MYATNAALGAASIAAFHRLLGVCFPGRDQVERTLVTALYALAPLWVAHAIFLNLDYAATVFYVLFLSCLFARRFWWANVWAIALIFSKETGGAAWGVTMAAYVIAFVPVGRASGSERLAMLRSHALLLVAPLTLLTYLALIAALRPDPAGWLNSYAPVGVIHDSWDAVLNTNLADSGFRSFLVDIFVLNFQWLYAVVIVITLGASLVRHEPRDREAAGLPRLGVFLALALIGLVYITTRFRPTNAPRYLLFRRR